MIMGIHNDTVKNTLKFWKFWDLQEFVSEGPELRWPTGDMLQIEKLLQIK